MEDNGIKKGGNCHAKLYILIFIILYIIYITATSVYGEEHQNDNSLEEDLSQNDLSADSIPKRELLLLQDISVVITPSKVLQSILESPSTITVLDKNDIRRYGLISFSDILRNIPGVDIVSVSPTDRNISMRGFDKLVAGRILSLVDGKPIYQDFYGMTLWESLPISVNEIDRIEIVRGPGSALYGANAFDGVVNIITDQLPSNDTSITAAVNHYGKLSGSMAHSGMNGNILYKASIGWDSISGWKDEDADAGENRRFNGTVKYNIDSCSSLSLSGGVKGHEGGLLLGSGFETREYSGTESYIRSNYSKSDLSCSLSWRRFSTDVKAQGENPPYWLNSNSFEAELQHSFYPLENNFLTWGLDYRFNKVGSDSFNPITQTQNLMAGYTQNQFRILDGLELTAGLRYDRHPLTGNNYSPRASLVYSPLKYHVLRASVGRAFQNPSFLYSYISTEYNYVLPIVSMPVNIKVLGNKELSPEKITSFELGYQGIFSPWLKGSVDVFSNKIKGLIVFQPKEYYNDSSSLYGSFAGLIPSAIYPVNQYDAKSRGGEIATELSINRWVSTNVNYSYQVVKNLKSGEIIETAPRHKLNPGLFVNLGQDILISLFANYVSRTLWFNVEIEPYVSLNSVISYRTFNGRLEASLSLYNLLDDRHFEHSLGGEIGRSVTLSLAYQIY